MGGSSLDLTRTLLGMSNSCLTERNKLCFFLWASKVITKIKFFVWHLFHGILPTTMALKGRGMNLNLDCRVCGEHEESILHFFFDCNCHTSFSDADCETGFLFYRNM